MKSFLYFTLIVAVLALGFVAFKAEAAPISWDYASGVLQPLQAAWSAQVKGSYFTATSTTASSTLPKLESTITNALNVCINGDCKSAWPAPGSGTVTQINTTWPILGGPITTTGTLTFGGLGTSTAAVVGNIPYFSGVNTFANVATTSVSSGTGISFSGTAGALVGGSNLTVTNSSPLSGLSASFPFSFSNPTLTWLGLGTSSPGITAGQPIYATGVNTIASVASSTFLTSIGGQATGNYITALTGDGTASGPGSAALTLATVNSNVGTFTYPSVTVNGKGLITAISSGSAPTTYSATYPVTLTGSAFGLAFGTTTANSWSALQTFVNASSTNLSASNAVYTTRLVDTLNNVLLWSGNSLHPAAFSGSVLGDVMQPWETAYIKTLNLTNALTAANGGTGATSLGSGLTNSGSVFSQVEHRSFTYATSTAWTGTTTIPIESGYGEVFNSVRCFTDAGTLGVDFYHSTSHLNYIPTASTTNNVNTFSTNNTITSGDKTYVDLGTPASSPTKISCTVADTY